MKTKISKTGTVLKTLIVFSFFAFNFSIVNAQYVGINKTGASPSAATILDLNTGNAGANKGFLPPQVALSAINTASPVSSPDVGLVIYNTATTGTAPNNVVPGYYYWDGTEWLLMLAPTPGTAGQVLTSNGGGVPSWTTLSGGGIGGSGTNNYVARFTPNGTTLGNSLVQDDGTQVGVNTAPVSGDMLHVTTSVGNAIYAQGHSYGVYANTDDLNGYYSGVYGQDDLNYGVEGFSANYIGVYGQGDNTYGVKGYSANSTGVNGTGVNGVVGSGTTNGVVGQTSNPSGYAVEGTNTGSLSTGISGTGGIIGISGTASQAGGYGVSGTASGIQSSGLYGTASGVLATGVYGISNGSHAIGVEGVASGIYGTGINGQSSNVLGWGVVGSNTAGEGILGEGISNGVDGRGDTGVNGTGTTDGVAGKTSNVNGYGVEGISVASGGTGIYGKATGTGSWGILGEGDLGIYGKSTAATGAGVEGDNSSGNGLYGYSSAAGYSGIIGYNPYGVGVHGTGDTGVSGDGITGVFGTGSFEGVTGNGNYAGVCGNGITAGTIGSCTATSGYGEDFLGYNNLTHHFIYAGYYDGTTEYKILGSGTVSTIVKDTKNKDVVLHAPETPEVYFEDYGAGQLINGKAHIDLDPDLAKNVTINEKHTLKVFIQLEGDCKGVFVTNKTATGFDVIELGGGNSNTPFSWHIVCNRADENLNSGKVSRFADLRFENAPAPVIIQNGKK